MAIIQKTFSWTPGGGFSEEILPMTDEAQLVMMFASGDLAGQWDEPIQTITSSYKNALVVGCSSAGEILDIAVNDASIAVVAVSFESTVIRGFSTKLNDGNTANAVTNLTRQMETDGLRYVLVLSDGLAVNGSDLATSIQAELPTGVLVTGGLAGDGDRFEHTSVFYNGDIQEKSLVAVGFYGDRLKVGHGSLGGWDPFGPERTVTRADDNVLYELDNQSALALYKQYLGSYSKDLPASGLLFPLSVRTEEGSEELVRTLLAVDEDEQSMTFAGSIPEGSHAKLMKANFDRLIDGAMEAATQTQEILRQDASLALLVSCVGRKMVLGDRIEEEVEAVRDVLGDTPAIVGFYSYGELSPVAEGTCQLHNQTMTITTLTED